MRVLGCGSCGEQSYLWLPGTGRPSFYACPTCDQMDGWPRQYPRPSGRNGAWWRLYVRGRGRGRSGAPAPTADHRPPEPGSPE